MAGTDRGETAGLVADYDSGHGAGGAGDGGLKTFFTDEMVEGLAEKLGLELHAYDDISPTGWVIITQTALKAIEPVIQKLLTKATVAGYTVGYNQAVKDLD